MSKGEGGHQIRTMMEKEGKGGGGKKSNILPDVLCEWPLSKVSKNRAMSIFPFFLKNTGGTETGMPENR